jgi:predicted ATP-dependent protease
MSAVLRLAPDQLSVVCDPRSLEFDTTDELSDLDEIVGQERAIEAFRFGIDIPHKGYNIFVLGPSGAGRYTMTGEFLKRAAATRPRPDDWCYVHNFSAPRQPRALRLPPGRALPFREAMIRLIADLRAALPVAFDSDEYRTHRALLEKQFKDRQKGAFRGIETEAQQKGLAIGQSESGIEFVPVHDGNVMPPDVFRALPASEREAIGAAIEALRLRLEDSMRQVHVWHKEMIDASRDLARTLAARIAAHEIAPLEAAFAGFPEVIAYLAAVRDDIIGNIADFLHPGVLTIGSTPQPDAAKTPPPSPSDPLASSDAGLFRRYDVNVLVQHSTATGAPVIFEDAPAPGTIAGRIEYAAQLGQLVTDFTLIRAGALHLANGGYLIIDARKLLMQPLAYDELKRALLSELIRVESTAQRQLQSTIASIDPEPIPLVVKVVLVGDPYAFHLLTARDEEFSELFKVQAELHDRVPHSPDIRARYARLIATLARRERLRRLDAGAVARLLEHSARMVDDRERLSTRFAHVLDIMRESDHWAGKEGAATIGAPHVTAAIAAQLRRADHVRELGQEQILRGWILIDVHGERVGMINGLSLLRLGNFMYGKPSRITVRVRIGRGEVIDIERRAELGGPLHSKGVFILAGYLGAKFAAETPLALTASLVFEQSYGSVEGDSASSAELFALLSALADLPIKQSLAVTGSVNQLGQVQAIGGVNEKIEGFFDICRARGLDGTQGVLIPQSNVSNLALRSDVVDAARSGLFSVFAIRTIDEGIELLTGVPAGEKLDDGTWTPGSVNARVADRVARWAAAARHHALRSGDEISGSQAGSIP